MKFTAVKLLSTTLFSHHTLNYALIQQ